MKTQQTQIKDNKTPEADNQRNETRAHPFDCCQLDAIKRLAASRGSFIWAEINSRAITLDKENQFRHESDQLVSIIKSADTELDALMDEYEKSRTQ